MKQAGISYLPFSLLSTHSLPSVAYQPFHPRHTRDWFINRAQFSGLYIPAHVCVSIFRQANTYTKLFLELGIVIGTQILDMLQECLLVDRPDRREEEHLEEEKNVENNVTICYFLRVYFSFSICWSLQQPLPKYSPCFRLTWVISCSWAAWTKTDKLNLHTFINFSSYIGIKFEYK